MITGPNLITNGLVLYLDATNPKSYPGNGTTWYDLSGNKKNGTIVNSPSFDSENKYFDFDGTNETVTISNPLNQSALEQEWTVSAWINITDKVSQTLVDGLNRDLFVCYTQGDNSLLYLNASADDYYTYGGDLGGIGWVMATFRFRNSDGYRTIYRNGIDISTTGPNNTSTPFGQDSTFTLFGALEGYVSKISMYNRVLTDDEVLQNYNATKTKFPKSGLTTAGLVLYLDAGNTDSYVSGDTTWYDLTTNDNDGTLVGGPTFDPTSGSSIVFDGDDDNINLGSITSGSTLMLNGSNITICAFIKKDTGGDTFQRIVDKSTSGGAVDGYSMWVNGSSIGFSVNNNNWDTDSSSAVSLNEWNYVSIVSGPSSTTSYVNGVEFVGSYYSGSYSSPPNSTANLRIGTWNHAGGREFKGNIAIVKIYNRDLSQIEILQNYNFLKSRFGL